MAPNSVVSTYDIIRTTTTSLPNEQTTVLANPTNKITIQRAYVVDLTKTDTPEVRRHCGSETTLRRPLNGTTYCRLSQVGSLTRGYGQIRTWCENFSLVLARHMDDPKVSSVYTGVAQILKGSQSH